jgi:hypothetical protein
MPDCLNTDKLQIYFQQGRFNIFFLAFYYNTMELIALSTEKLVDIAVWNAHSGFDLASTWY